MFYKFKVYNVLISSIYIYTYSPHTTYYIFIQYLSAKYHCNVVCMNLMTCLRKRKQCTLENILNPVKVHSIHLFLQTDDHLHKLVLYMQKMKK